jgi:hypothetical protein
MWENTIQQINDKNIDIQQNGIRKNVTHLIMLTLMSFCVTVSTNLAFCATRLSVIRLNVAAPILTCATSAHFRLSEKKISIRNRN